MRNVRLQTIIEQAISKADSSYFFENYTKQARAVFAAIEAAGFTITPKDFSEEVWKRVANEMKTGRIKPEEHAKDVFQLALRIGNAP